MAVAITLADFALECRALQGEERLGAASRFELTLAGAASIDLAALLRAPCGLTFETRYGERTFAGVVLRATAVGTARRTAERTLRLTVASRIALLAFRRRCRIFQHRSIPDIVRLVLEEGGYGAGDVRAELAEDHAPRRYVVQYDEDDASFVRRLCEDEGLFFRFDAEDGREIVTLADRSASAPAGLAAALPLVGDSKLVAPAPTAFDWVTVCRRRPGTVRLRDHDPEKPAVALDATARAGTAAERQAAVYLGRGGFGDAASGDVRARRHLESLRADASIATFATTALALAPGVSFAVAPDGSVAAPPREAEHVVIAVRHDWSASSDRHVVVVEAIPRATPYRLARETPRPRIAGLASAIVTGASGAEIHPDELGRVFLHFHWDEDGPRDHESSLPVRVLAPNLAGSMLLPRVGWEVLVAFEDGNPERPYVVGRAYNAKMPPPFALPANKMVTSIATDSSPGRAGTNSIHFDDAAGRQHLKIQATFGKTTTVGSNLVAQTAVNERLGVTGSQSRSVGGSESLKVGQALLETLGVDTVSIGATDELDVAGSQNVTVGSETVVVGGSLIEQVGDPLKGLANLAVASILADIGSLGPKGALASAALGIAKNAAEAGMKDGWGAAAKAVGMGAVGSAAGLIPGGEALLSAITGATQPNPWDHAKDGGERAGGGGAGGGASDAAGASGPGPGHRNVLADAGGFELNGGLSILTPGRVAWTTAGASLVVTGGSKSTLSSAMTYRTLGGSLESLGTSSITSATAITRSCNGSASMAVAGALTETAGANYVLKAPATSISASSLTLAGGTIVFATDGAQLVITSGGVRIYAQGSIKVVGHLDQSGDMVVP